MLSTLVGSGDIKITATCFPMIAIMNLMPKCAKLAVKYLMYIISFNSQSNNEEMNVTSR